MVCILCLRCFSFFVIFLLMTADSLKASVESAGISDTALLSYFIYAILVFFIIVLFVKNRSLKKAADYKGKDLQKNKKLFDDVLDAMPDMIWLKDGDGKYLMCNEELAKLVDSGRERIIGSTDYDIFPKEKADSYRHHDLIAIKNRKTTINEETADYIHDEYSIWIETSKTPLYDTAGELIGILGVGRELSSGKEGQEYGREKQKFLNQVMDCSPVPMLICSPDGTALRASNTYYTLMNLEASEVIGKYNMKQDENLKKEGVADKIELLLKKKQPIEFDFYWEPELVKGVDFSGGYSLYLNVSVFPLLDDDMEITHIVAQGSDITERIEAEEKLRQSEIRYRAVAEDIPVLICRFLPGGEIDYVNDAYCKYFNKTAGELIGSTFLSLIPEADHKTVMDGIEALNADAPTQSHEHKVIGQDGDIRWQRWTNRALFDADSKIIAYQSIGEDITEQKEADADRERLMLAISQAAEIVVITDTDGIIEYVNPAFEQITGYSREEAIGQNPRILKSGEQDDRFYTEMWQTLKRGEVWIGRLVNKKKDSTLYTEEAIISPVHDETGRIVKYVAVKRDITKELVLETQLRQSQKMEAVGRLAGGVAHDFNNMLGVILGHVDLILEESDSYMPFYNNLVEIHKASLRSADLTKQLLAFARKQTVAPKIIDLNKTVNGMMTMLHRLIGEGIELVWLPGSNLWPVRIDPGQVDQILANLCVNARDAIDGVGKIVIETQNTVLDEAYCENIAGLKPGEYILLTVSDTGCGIDAETIDNVFEPFFTTKESGKGTGLGLATVYGVVKQNDGFINVYSEPDKGTVFKIYLPGERSEQVQTHEEEEGIQAECGSETILLVEDEPAILKMTKVMLEKEGYKVVPADTPGKALEIARNFSGKIHLLITDVVMPEMNGRELAGNILKTHPDLKRLFMSGYTADVIAHHGVLDEAVNFIQKPFSKSDLALKVREAIDK